MKLFLFVALFWAFISLGSFQGQVCVDSSDCDKCEACVTTPQGGRCVEVRGCPY